MKKEEIKEAMDSKLDNETLEINQDDAVGRTEKPNLSPPWITYANEIIALFGADPEIKVKYEEEEYLLKLFVDNAIKADALSRIIPQEKVFGNVILRIEVIPSNNLDDAKNIYKHAFSGNPNVAFIRTVEDNVKNEYTYIVFNRIIAQFFNDDISDYYGNKSILLQDIAREVLEQKNGVYYCTEDEHKEKGNG